MNRPYIKLSKQLYKPLGSARIAKLAEKLKEIFDTEVEVIKKEEKKMDLQVGDKITYKYLNNGDDLIHTAIIYSDSDLSDYKERLEDKTHIGSIEILRIERSHYELLEEKKELLTEEEKEFLKEFITFNNNKEMHIIRKVENFIFIYGFDYERIANFKIYNLRFKNLEEYKEYTLKELGLE